MKAFVSVVLIIGCAVMPGLSRALPLDAGWQHNTTDLNAAGDGTAHSTDTEVAPRTRKTLDQKRASLAHRRSGRILPSKKINANRRLEATRGDSLMPVQASSDHLGPPAPMTAHHGNSTNLGGSSHRFPAFMAGKGVAIGGQQFKEGRHSRAFTVGGSANTRTGTAAINGTDVTRRR